MDQAYKKSQKQIKKSQKPIGAQFRSHVQI